MDAIGKYRVVKRIAVGGMGEIFLARERGVAGLERLVVLKTMLPELAERADSVALFVDEARIAAHLAHPNLVQIYELGRDGETYFIAMEYVPGQHLGRICERAMAVSPRPLTYRIAAHIVAELAHGLAFAHQATDAEGAPLAIVHRDVSPSNVLLSIHGDVKVMDFGIAKSANAMHHTRTGTIRGKYAYMAPEQLAGSAVTAAVDVYAAGVVLWELSLLRRMFRAKDELELIDRVRLGSFARPSELDPDYPPELEAIAMHALARDPSARGSAAELARALRSFVSSTGPTIERPQLGALVRELFPDVDYLATRTPEPEPVTASMPQVRTAPTVPSAPPPRNRSRALGLGAAGVIAAVTTVVVIQTRPGATEVAVIDPVPDVPDAPIARAVLDASIAADTVEPAVEDQPDAAVRVARRPDAARSRATVPAGPRVGSPANPAPGRLYGAGPVVDPEPPPSVEPPVSRVGTLIVEAEPWGTVIGAGIPAGTLTPGQFEVGEGIHDLGVAFSEGGATVRTRVQVQKGKRTRCNATTKGLVCSPPK